MIRDLNKCECEKMVLALNKSLVGHYVVWAENHWQLNDEITGAYSDGVRTNTIVLSLHTLQYWMKRAENQS